MQASIFDFIPLIMLSIFFGFLGNKLAKEKGRDVTLWTILGVLPLANMFCFWFFIGAANLKVERKLDEAISKLDSIVKNKLGSDL